MPKSQAAMDVLLQKANTLPLCPGVYIMRDKNQKIIYVGKSKKLKNRVSQYFQNNRKNMKTSRMVACVEDFEYILCKTEIEALSLENALIKQHTPKYNIRLKDAKSYPYIKITSDVYPRIVYTRSRLADKAKYFGPFSGTAAVFSILDILHKSLGIPNCKRSFPKDIGKERPCIYYQMGQCCGVCTGKVSEEEYSGLIHCATEILRGHTAASMRMLEDQMLNYAEEERYEAAARCRDTIRSLKQLSQKQNVVASPEVNVDVFGLCVDQAFACISVMYVRDGVVIDKNDFSFGAEALEDVGALSAFLVEHYMMRQSIPKQIMLSFSLEEGDDKLLEEFLSSRSQHRVEVRQPERGHFRELCETVVKNAAEKVRQNRLDAQKDEQSLFLLAEMLGLESLPERIEAYDISNVGSENIVAGMIVFEKGKALKKDYRSFNIQSVLGKPDDYSSMKEALTRRLQHLKDDSEGALSEYPDMILLDGGKGHVATVREVLRNMEIDIPIFGMVKDDYHKTRALCTEEQEINIAREKSVYMLIYKIQEEVHRYTVSRTMNAKRKTLRHSSLEKIDGIGPSKAKKLLEAMGTLGAIKNSSKEEISKVKGISEIDAVRIYEYFHGDEMKKAETEETI